MSRTGEVLREFVRRWWLIGLLTVLGASAGLGYALLRQPVYAAKAYVVVVAQNSNDSTAVSYAQAYARIAGQGETLAAAVRSSNGDVTAGELRRAVRSSSSPDAPVIEVTGSAYPARRAADLANLVADGLISTANRHSSDTRVKLVLLSEAAPPLTPASPRPVLDIAVGAAAGLLLGGLALLGRPRRAGAGATGSQPLTPTPRVPTGGTPMDNAPRWTGTASVFYSSSRFTPRQGPGQDDGNRGTAVEGVGDKTRAESGIPERANGSAPRDGSRTHSQRRAARAKSMRRRPH